MLPPATRRLFAHYRSGDLDAVEARAFVALGLAEEGDREDLRWFVGRWGEDALRRTLERHGARQLSRRSLAFWRRLLALRPGEDSTGSELWPR